MEKFSIGFSSFVFLLGTYFIWFDRKNIFNHSVIGLWFVSSLVPLSIFELSSLEDPDILNLYANINLIGSICFIIGLFFGYKWRRIVLINSIMQFSLFENAIHSSTLERRVISISNRVFVISLIVMALCFAYMGYLPMFAADPYSAKQFKGIYQPRYQHVALFYRTAKQFIQLLLPILLLEYYERKKLTTLLMVLAGVALIFVSMSRGETVAGLLIIASIIVALKKSRKPFIAYIIFIVLFFSIGSSLWVVLAYYFPNSGFTNLIDGQSASEAIASGAPDILDQLHFLHAFVRNNNDFTYGLTFIGGFVPFNFKYNPSAWTLYVLNDTNDISEVASGGLRLTIPMWGYVSFGWFGVVLLPFLSAFFTGYIIKKIKRIVNQLKSGFKGYFMFYLIAFLFTSIGIIFTTFYDLTIYQLPGFIFFAFLVFQIKKANKLAESSKENLTVS